ncbi:Oxysterol-binding protein-related protein 6 [Plecturocebus cupreus]
MLARLLKLLTSGDTSAWPPKVLGLQSIHILERTASSSTEPSVSRQLLEPEPVPLSKEADSWEIIEGLKIGQTNVQKPDKHEGFMLKKRKWPLKGWHKRWDFTMLSRLVLNPGSSDQLHLSLPKCWDYSIQRSSLHVTLENSFLHHCVGEVTEGSGFSFVPILAIESAMSLIREAIQKGKVHGSIDVGLSVMSIKKKARRIDLDTEEHIYHLKVKSQDWFDAWVSKLRHHRLYRQNEIVRSPRDASFHIFPSTSTAESSPAANVSVVDGKV